MSTSAPDAVKRLVDRFDQDRNVSQSPDYKEEQLSKSKTPQRTGNHRAHHRRHRQAV
jgi:hypothetical protein